MSSAAWRGVAGGCRVRADPRDEGDEDECRDSAGSKQPCRPVLVGASEARRHESEYDRDAADVEGRYPGDTAIRPWRSAVHHGAGPGDGRRQMDEAPTSYAQPVADGTSYDHYRHEVRAQDPEAQVHAPDARCERHDRGHDVEVHE